MICTMIIKVNALAKADPELVWRAWNDPEHICRWNAASDDWHTVSCEVDLRQGGRLSSRMEAKDGSVGFDFGGVYSRIVPGSLLEFIMDDGRVVTTEFKQTDAGVLISEAFEAEKTNSEEMQRQGWQAILDNFVRYVEAL
ncbi:SRPBCC family protein [Shewanella algae]|uniref:SRPBCC family protein n=2 Tax=Shewanellaceae TaxID=267890 RepID=UPI0031F559F7